MNGFEIEVKKRLLAFSPHLTLRYAPNGTYEPILDWEEQSKKIQGNPEVLEVKGTIDDNAIIEHNENQLPISYRGIDTADKEQIAKLEELVIKDFNQDATADLGLDAKGLILESKANQFGINVGDIIQLYSTRNFDEVIDAYKRTDRPRAFEEYKKEFTSIVEQLKAAKISNKPAESFKYDDLKVAFSSLLTLLDHDLRKGEENTINEALDILDSGKKMGASNELRILPKGSTEHLENLLLIHLANIDNTQDDNDEFKKLRSIVLPKEIKIVGIYRISQQVVAPDIFLPLPVAQELSGLEDGVHALSLRIKDVDRAEALSQDLSKELDYGWYPSSWMSRYRDFFELVELEKSMMSMVLSIVSLGAAFLIMIVMFLTALQKRKEIGVMLAVGANPAQVCGIFFIQGVVIGILGVLLGIALGLLILHFRGDIQMFFLMQGVNIFPAEFQGMDSLPANTPFSLILKVGIMGLVLCALAPLFPALYAANTDPAKSLRNL